MKTQYFNTGTVEFGKYFNSIAEAPWQQIEVEPQLHKSSASFALEHGGPFTQEVLAALQQELSTQDFQSLSIDTKVHMLHKGWYPCIGGWHGDFVYRENGNIQPDEQRDKGVRHFLLVSGEPLTQFISRRNIQTHLKTPHWGDISAIIAKTIPAKDIYSVPSATLVEFTSNELHRGVASPLDQFTWRYLFRATLFPGDHPLYNPNLGGKVRMQQQVYLDVNAGW